MNRPRRNADFPVDVSPGRLTGRLENRCYGREWASCPDNGSINGAGAAGAPSPGGEGWAEGGLKGFAAPTHAQKRKEDFHEPSAPLGHFAKL